MFEVPLDIQLLQHIQGTIVLGKYKQNPDPLNDKSGNKKQNKQTAVYRPADFDYDPATHTCVCPAGKTLYGNGSHCVINGFNAIKFQGAQQDCVPCSHRDKCLRTPARTNTRQVAFFQGKVDGGPIVE